MNAVFAADAEIGSDAVPLPILDRQFRCRFWIGSDTVCAADTEIGSDLVSAADTEIGSDAVFAADTEIGSDPVSLPIPDRQRCSLRCQYRNRQRPSFAVDSLIGSDVVSAADFRIGND